MSNGVPGGMVLVAGGCPAGCGTGVPGSVCHLIAPQPGQCSHRGDIYHSNHV